MKEPLFFFDTADLDYVKRTWDKLSKTVKPRFVAGITTNPNALNKIQCHSVKAVKQLIENGTGLLSQIRPRGYAEFHVQIPNSNMTGEQAFNWIDTILLAGNAHSPVAIKVPPYKPLLDFIEDEAHVLRYPVFNVTGLSDAASALRCLSYKTINYVSIIPGRMEEVGINADLHLLTVTSRNVLHRDSQEVIAGSMRTVDGLKRSIQAGCVPTIGSRVWDSMTEQNYEEFVTWWDVETPVPSYLQSIPFTDERNLKLTQDFFSQMDVFGQSLYDDFCHGSW